MASLPNLQAVDERWLTPAGFEALLLSGAETLCLSTNQEEECRPEKKFFVLFGCSQVCKMQHFCERGGWERA